MQPGEVHSRKVAVLLEHLGGRGWGGGGEGGGGGREVTTLLSARWSETACIWRADTYRGEGGVEKN